MKIFYLLLFFFFSCCNTDFFLATQKDRLHDLTLKSISKWELGIKIEGKKEKAEVNNLVIISKNLACEEPEISENKEICKSEISRLKNDYNEIMAFCLTENDDYGYIKKTRVVINDMFFYSLYWTDEIKINVISHEIGHCLGLKHVYIDKNIMYPFQENGLHNFNPQRAILKKLYLENDEPSEIEKNKYFQHYKEHFLRHEKIPSFYLKI
jgi:hypothetical protein